MSHNAEMLPERKENVAYDVDLLTIWKGAQELAAAERGQAATMQDLAPSVARHLGYESAYSEEVLREVSLEEGELHPLKEADRLAAAFDERHPETHAQMGYALDDESSRKFLRQVMVWHVHEARRLAEEKVITLED